MTKAATRLAGEKFEFQENRKAVSLAQKIELLGQLNEAIAYQFNNLMMAVTSYAELELKKAAPPQKRNLEQMLSNAARATSLIQKLLVFSRKQTPSPQPLHLNTSLTEINGLIQLLFGDHIEVVLSLAPDVQAVKADPVELQQLVLSLALNAGRAISAGGKLNISTEMVELDSTFLATGEGLTPGKYVLLSVNNSGNDPATQKHNSESTQTGDQNLKAHLALTAVRGMVKEAHGLIRVSNSAQNGNSFKIYFPALGLDVKKTTAAAMEGAVKNLAISKTILVVEDDDAVRMPAAEFLMMEGFKVLQAKTGPEALEMIEQHRSPLDLLITDILMPEMSGREVAGKLVEKYPDLKILYMSGHVDEATTQDGIKGSQKAVLQKPFRLNVLNDEIHDLLRD